MAWSLQISANPRRTSSAQGCRRLQKPSRSVSFDTHVDILPPVRRSVSWSGQVEVFIIPARECAPNDCTPRLKSTAEPRGSSALTPTTSASFPPLKKPLLISGDLDGLRPALDTKHDIVG